MPLYRLPDPGDIRVLNEVSASVSILAEEQTEARRQLEHIHLVLEERMLIPDESQSEIASEQGK